MSDYTIDRGFGVRERMDLLAKVFGPSTGVLLDLVGVAEGARCVDLGCGAGHVAHELARRAGPTGAVTGIDLDAELLEVARAEAVRLNLPQVTFRVGAVEAALDVESVDLAYARMLVMHVRDPAQVVATMVAAVCSGGVVVVEDLNFAGSFTFPPCVAFDRCGGRRRLRRRPR